CYLRFGDLFEQYFLTQDEHEDRSISQTLDIGWSLLSLLPRTELYRIDPKLIDQYLTASCSAVSDQLRKAIEEARTPVADA
ncbi:V-type ATP synthase subunit B, partial [Treponema pallidum]